MRIYLTRRKLTLTAMLVILAAIGLCVYLMPPGHRWIVIVAGVAGVVVGVTSTSFPRPPGREP